MLLPQEWLAIIPAAARRLRCVRGFVSCEGRGIVATTGSTALADGSTDARKRKNNARVVCGSVREHMHVVMMRACVHLACSKLAQNGIGWEQRLPVSEDTIAVGSGFASAENANTKYMLLWAPTVAHITSLQKETLIRAQRTCVCRCRCRTCCRQWCCRS